MKNILLLSPIYPASDIPKSLTPVVHYFAREWVKMGYNVLVVNYISNFPQWFNMLFAPFNKKLSSITGVTVRKNQATEISYEIEGVRVKRIPLLKLIPHSRFSESEISKAFEKTINFCEENSFIPDCVIGHWFNPQLDLLSRLKHRFNVPSILVLHNGYQTLFGTYKDKAVEMMNDVDVIGFRSDALKRNIQQKIKIWQPTFYCYSGIPEQFLSTEKSKRKFNDINSFVFVGTLFKRKYPLEIIYALEDSYKNVEYRLSYVGVGSEQKRIKKLVGKLHKDNCIKLLGRVDRKKVQQILHENDVFVMISRNEAFGLVYLEAMAAGCITIASRNEGFDGIIKDGVNGFLCEAGNVEELSSIITKIRKMDRESLSSISEAAKETARGLSDKLAAYKYISSVENILNK